MVSAADTNPGMMARQGAMTNALINPALRTLREKLIDMTPPLIFNYSDGFYYHLRGVPNDFSPIIRAFGFASCLGLVIRVFGWFEPVRELVLVSHNLPDLLLRQELLPGLHLRLRDPFRHSPEPEAVRETGGVFRITKIPRPLFHRFTVLAMAAGTVD